MTKYCNFHKNDAYQELLCMALSAAEDQEHLAAFKSAFLKVDEQKLYEQAIVDEVGSHMAYKLKKCELPLSEKWEKTYNEVDQRISQLMTELERVAQHLSKTNIKIIALKNAGITKGLYQNPACSPMGDIDLLIGSKDFRKAHEIIMNELGYTFKFRSELEEEDLEEAFRGGGTEYYRDLDGNRIWLELQWRPVAGRWIQPHNEPNGDELVADSHSIENSAVRILNPVDNLLQVALHTAKHSFCRAPGFRLHSDVDRIVRFSEIDWDVFLAKVESLKLKTAVYFSLGLAKELVDTPIPDNVIKALEPSNWNGKTISKYLNRAGLFNQKKNKFSKLGYIIFNLSLYDSKSEIFQAIIPPAKTLKARYGFSNNLMVPFYHIKRILELVLKRAKL